MLIVLIVVRITMILNYNVIMITMMIVHVIIMITVVVRKVIFIIMIIITMMILMINNGNRTEWSPLRSVIIREISKIGRPQSRSPICQSRV